MGINRVFQLIIATTSLAILTGCMSIIPAIAPDSRNIEEDISADFPYERERIAVLDSEMSYVDVGTGRTYLLVHGNPTSAYLWRNVIPVLEDRGRVIAVDLIGFGESGKPDIDYTLDDHIRYFTAFVAAMDLSDIVLVLHDWGGALGVDYAVNHLDNVLGIATFESVIRPHDWNEASWAGRYIFRRLRDPERGERLIAEQNYFIEQLLPMMSGRELSDAEMEAYREPFPTAETRRPVALFPREIPIAGEPERTHRRISANYEALASSDLPILLLFAEPGMIVTETSLAILKQDIPRLQTAPIGSGYHYLQEVQPTLIGQLVIEWGSNL